VPLDTRGRLDGWQPARETLRAVMATSRSSREGGGDQHRPHRRGDPRRRRRVPAHCTGRVVTFPSRPGAKAVWCCVAASPSALGGLINEHSRLA